MPRDPPGLCFAQRLVDNPYLLSILVRWSFQGVPSPGFVTPAPLTDSQQGTLVSPLMGQTFALGPPGLCFTWGAGQLSPPYFAAGFVVLYWELRPTGSSLQPPPLAFSMDCRQSLYESGFSLGSSGIAYRLR